MHNNENNNEDVSVIDFVIRQKTSKKNNVYKCLVAIDENGDEHFIAFINSK